MIVIARCNRGAVSELHARCKPGVKSEKFRHFFGGLEPRVNNGMARLSTRDS